jgi:hypothetical protein
MVVTDHFLVCKFLTELLLLSVVVVVVVLVTLETRMVLLVDRGQLPQVFLDQVRIPLQEMLVALAVPLLAEVAVAQVPLVLLDQAAMAATAVQESLTQ